MRWSSFSGAYDLQVPWSHFPARFPRTEPIIFGANATLYNSGAAIQQFSSPRTPGNNLESWSSVVMVNRWPRNRNVVPLEQRLAKKSRSRFRRVTVERLETRCLLTAIGGRVWDDLDADGIQDDGEPGLGGVVVELFQSWDGTVGNADDVSRGMTILDASGSYGFAGEANNTNYYLTFRVPAGFEFAPLNQGDNPVLDSDVDPRTGRTVLFNDMGQADLNFDVGVVGTAPWFGFAAGMSGDNDAEGRAVAVDAAGNVLIAGSFKGTIDFDPGPGVCNLGMAGTYDAFVAKYSATGSLYWASSIGGRDGDWATGIAVDRIGSVYVTGYFSGTAVAGVGSIASPLVSAGDSDVFVVKLDAAGTFVWVRSLGGTGSDEGAGIAVDDAGNVYTTGTFWGPADFDPGAGVSSLGGAGGGDVFVSKLDNLGNFVWARSLGGASYDEGKAIAVDGNANVYTTGTFRGTGDFDPGSGTSVLGSPDTSSVFVSKLDGQGNFTWARAQIATGSGYPVACGLAVDRTGNVYNAGYFLGAVDFDPGTGSNTLSSAGGEDIFVSKLDAAGDLVWARAMGGLRNDRAYGVAVDGAGNVLTTGYFTNTADFDPGSGIATLTIHRRDSDGRGNDIFVSKLDPAGNLAGARALGGIGDDEGLGIATDPGGDVYVTGHFWGSADFDPSPASSFNVTGGAGRNVFVSKSTVPHCPTDVALEPTELVANQPSGTSVGQLTAADPDPQEVFTFSLATGHGDTDNDSFTINNSQSLTADLRTTRSLTAGDHSIRVRVTDADHAWLEKILTVNVVPEPQGAIVGGRVWRDVNGNGLQDAGESGVRGVVVQLFLSADAVVGNGDDWQVAEQLTDGQGRYRFSGLISGHNYYLAYRGPGEHQWTIRHATGDASVDSDVEPTTGRTAMFSLLEGQSRSDFDAGLVGEDMGLWPAFRSGGVGDDRGAAVAIDEEGYVYVAGSFQGTADFDIGPGMFILTSVGSFDVFVAKYSTSGTLLWARSMGGTGDDQARDVVVDRAGNVYTTGHFEGTADFDPGPAASNLSALISRGIFVSKLDSAGNFVWADKVGGFSSDEDGLSLALGADGSVYYGGHFFEGDFDPGDGFTWLYGGPSAFISRLDAAGGFLWARMFLTQDGSNATASGVAVDSAGNVYVTGRFRGTVDFDPGPGSCNLTSNGDFDVFVAKLNAAGNFVWAHALGGAGSDWGMEIVVDDAGDAYTTGHFSGTVDFDPGPGEDRLTSAGGEDIFVSKWDAAGNHVWARALGGTGDDQGNDVALDRSGGIYTTGYYDATVVGDPGGGTGAGVFAAFVSQLDPAGNVIASGAMGGDGSTWGIGIAVDGKGTVCTTGAFSGTTDFDSGLGSFALTSAGGLDIFLAWSLPAEMDSDGDGVTDVVESAAPYLGDGNQDGQPDSQQPNVASLPNPENGTYVTLVAPAGQSLVAVRVNSNPSPSNMPATVAFPLGFIDFSLTSQTTMSSTVITMYVEPGTVANTYYKFGPTSDQTNPHWYPFMFDGVTGVTVFSNRIEVHLTDGMRGDDDLQPNNEIAHAGAPGQTLHPWQNPVLPYDVSNDGHVAPLDVLILINDINAHGTRSLPIVPSGPSYLPPYLDPSGDDGIAPADVLIVINYINANSAPLAWEVRLMSVPLHVDQRFFADAHDGSLVHQIDAVSHLDREIYDCSNSTNNCRLDEPDGDYVYGRSEEAPARGVNPLVNNADADLLYGYAYAADDYFWQKFQRDGSNQQGGTGNGVQVPYMTTRVYANYSGLDCPDANYFSGAFYFCPSTGAIRDSDVDIMGHEYAHAVQEAVGNRNTSDNQSGMISEGFADVFGEALEYYVTGTNDWVEAGLRDFANPLAHHYPDSFYSRYFSCSFALSHVGATVIDKAAYLTAMGGTFKNLTIEGLGRDKEEAIWYRAMTQYVASSETFNLVYVHLIQACEDLYGYPASHELAKALRSVELDQPGRCSGIAEKTPVSPPEAPTIGAAAGNAQATVSFTPPAVTDVWMKWYMATSIPGNITASSTTSPITVTGLTNGTTYTFTVTATSVVGTSAASAASNPATPGAGSGLERPDAPTIGTATAGNAQATVSFSPPTSDGGSPITSYTVASSPGGITASGAASPITVTGLTNGTTYTFTVTATNEVGTGDSSAASNAVTPMTVPDAPTIGTATGGNAQASITFTAPASNGGSAITSYTVTSTPGGITAGGSASPLTIQVDVGNPWHNVARPYDVNGDGIAAAEDLPDLVNYINQHPGQAVLGTPGGSPHPYYDVNNDGRCTPIDALIVINWINSHPAGAGEGEAVAPWGWLASADAGVGYSKHALLEPRLSYADSQLQQRSGRLAQARVDADTGNAAFRVAVRGSEQLARRAIDQNVFGESESLGDGLDAILQDIVGDVGCVWKRT